MVEKFIVPDFDEADLKNRLSDIRWPNEYQEGSVNWEYGAPSWAVKDMVHEWKNNYSWKKTCEKLNRWHHYRTKVNGLNIHFVHEPSSNKNAIPIILIHGWPSTFYEFYKLIEPLRDSPRQVSISDKTQWV